MQQSLFGDLQCLASAVLFAGLGGACEGIRRATHSSPLVAINHSDHAIQLHALNHPETMHCREDVWAVHPASVIRGRRLDLLWLSPDCTHHSRAKGAAPRESHRRSLADVVFRWVDSVQPRIIMLENVPEWIEWGPLDSNGQPDKAHKGELFRAWVMRLNQYGYRVEWRILEAHRYGVPTSRKRVYLIARRDAYAIMWPRETHGPGMQPFRTARECIDWSIAGNPIRDDMSVKTLDRIAQGRRLFRGNPFLITYYGNGQAVSIDRPLPTVTTVDRFALIQGDTHRMLQPRELARAMGFPEAYRLIGSKRDQVARIGNAVCPHMAEVLVQANL